MPPLLPLPLLWVVLLAGLWLLVSGFLTLLLVLKREATSRTTVGEEGENVTAAAAAEAAAAVFTASGGDITAARAGCAANAPPLPVITAAGAPVASTNADDEDGTAGSPDELAIVSWSTVGPMCTSTAVLPLISDADDRGADRLAVSTSTPLSTPAAAMR